MADDSTKLGPPLSNKEADNGNGRLEFTLVDTYVCVDQSEGSITIKLVAAGKGSEFVHLSMGSPGLPARAKPQIPETITYSVKELTRILGMTDKMVRKLIRHSHLKALPGSRHYKITQEALDSYLNAAAPPNTRSAQCNSRTKGAVAKTLQSGSNLKPALRTSKRGCTELPKREDEIQLALDEMKQWDK